MLLAITTGRRSAGMKMLRQQIIRWLVYILVWGLLFPGIDNMAHLGGLATGFILGRIMMDRPPMTPDERKQAYLFGLGGGTNCRGGFCDDGVQQFASGSLGTNRPVNSRCAAVARP